MRRAAKRDVNHQGVGDYLRAQGWSVLDLASAGNGIPDYAVGAEGFACLVEVKNPQASPKHRELTPAEKAIRDRWEGPYIIALSGEQAHADLCALRSGAAIQAPQRVEESTTVEEAHGRAKALG